jgi:hypothetical protein
MVCLLELLAMMFKMHHLMRVFPGMAKIVDLVESVFRKSAQFLIFFLFWMTAQALAMMITGTEIETVEYKFVQNDDGNIVPGDDDGYDKLPRFFQYWLINF